MDRKHQLEAPDNDSLKIIEQLDDHSGLTTMYPQAHDQWDGTIMSTTDREVKRDKELAAITNGVTKWAIPIGLLAIAPVVVAALLLSLVFTYINEDNAPILLFPMMLITAIWGIASFFAIKKLYGIFYNHALRATPFLVILLVLMGLSVQGIFMLTRTLQNSSAVNNVLIIGGIALVVSMALSWILLHIWTTKRIAANTKLALIGVVAFILLAIATIATIA